MMNTTKSKIFESKIHRRLTLLVLILVQVILTRVYAQTATLTIQKKDVTVKEILSTIEKSSQIVFFYADKDVDPNRKVTINLVNQPISKVLEELFKNSPNTFKVDGKQVYIKRKPKQVDDDGKSGIKKTKIVGIVTDQTGEAIIGAAILVKGTKAATVTDLHGRFYLEVPEQSLLTISYLGYLPQEVNIGSDDFVNVEMVEDTKSLEEVVVVGYGTQKKLTTIGAQSSLTIKDLKAQPIANISNAVSGRIAGVIAVQRSGEPGYDGSQIYIRGISTFTNSSPLILVDGIERSFNNIDPEDIAGFTVLKDASATAVYGVRGANGVIIIETRKGEVGKPKINIQFNQGITQFTQIPKFVDGPTYMRMANEAYKNTYPTSTTPQYSDDAIQKTADGTDPDLYPDVNWMKELFKKTGQNHRINMNINGGTEKSKYYVSFGTYNEIGLFKVDEMAKYNSAISFNRYNFTCNLSLQIFKNTKLDFGASGWVSNGNYPGSSTVSIWDAAFKTTPISMPVRYSDGKMSGVRAADVPNPYMLLTQTGYVTEVRSQIWSNIRLTQDLSPIIKGLSITGLFSYDNYNSHRIARTKTVDEWLAEGRDDNDGQLMYTTGAPLRVGSSYLGFSKTNGGTRQFYTEAAINYNRSFGEHDVTGLILYNQSDKVDAQANDFISSLPYRYQGLAARATYSYDNKYLTEVNVGYNGAETFEEGHRFGLFPSAGIGWVASSEKFFQAIEKAIQFLKIRGSYGIVGNSNIGAGRRFGYLTTVNENLTGYTFGSDDGASYGGLDFQDYGSNVTWEKAKKLNIGFELRTLAEALSLTVDVFQENRTNIFLQRGDLPSYVGVRNSIYGNWGEMYSKGIDATMAYNKKITKDLTVEFRGNFTWDNATIVQDAQAPWPFPWQQRIGRKYGQRFGKIALGLFQTKDEIANSPYQSGDIQPGDIKFKDLNGDGIIDNYDQAPIGNGSMPSIVYGFGSSVSYKGIALGAWFKGISSVDIYTNGEGFQPFSQEGTRGNLLFNIVDRWTPENPGSNHFYPRLTYPSSVNTNYDNSSWWIKDGAFLRLQNVELSYTFQNKNWLKSIGLSHLRIYSIGYNLLTFSKFKLWDVELGDGKGANYPLTKTFNLGIECNF